MSKKKEEPRLDETVSFPVLPYRAGQQVVPMTLQASELVVTVIREGGGTLIIRREDTGKLIAALEFFR